MDADKVESQRPSRLSVLQKTQFVFTILNISCFFQFANIQFLPSSIRALEMDLSFSARQLSSLVLAETFSSLFSMPIWGVLTDLYEIKWVLMSCLFFSSVFLSILSIMNDFYSVFFFRLLNGSMLYSLVPITQKFVAISSMKNSVYPYGFFHSLSNIGRLVCSVVVASHASNVYYGIYGWRICSFALGVCCCCCCLLSLLIPRLKPKNYNKSLYDIINLDDNRNFSSALRSILRRFCGIMSIRTVRILTLGTLLGQGPYTASYFFILYLQYCRVSNFKSGVVGAVTVLGSSFGGLVGGLFADRIHHRFPRLGLIFIGLISISVRLFTICILLFYFTFDRVLGLYPVALFVYFILGITLASLGTIDRSLFSAVIMPSEQSFGIASVLFISGTTGSLIFPIVFSFFLKVVFHYQDNDKDVSDLPDDFVRHNAFALRNSFAIILIFSTICNLLMYIFLINTYYDDALGIKEKIDKKTQFSKVKVVTDSSIDTISRNDATEFRD